MALFNFVVCRKENHILIICYVAVVTTVGVNTCAGAKKGIWHTIKLVSNSY